MYLVYVILLGLVAGWAAGKIMKGSGYGAFTDILLGILGALVGNRLLGLLGLYNTWGFIPSLLVAMLGAVILVSLLRLIKRG